MSRIWEERRWAEQAKHVASFKAVKLFCLRVKLWARDTMHLSIHTELYSAKNDPSCLDVYC